MAVETGKYTLAWFKLAEFVWRKEKERALAIYRLLAHSLHDDALASQLEGDILLSFKDEKGFNSYAKAAALYEKHEKFASAAALYENLSLAQPDIFEYAHKSVHLYALLHNDYKFNQAAEALVKLVVSQKVYHEIDIVAQNLSQKYYCLFGEKVTIQLLLAQSPEAVMKDILHKTLDKQLACGESPQNFLAHLAAIDNSMYQYACNYINQLI